MGRRKCDIWTATALTQRRVNQRLTQGEVVALPTETVYGLAARADCDRAVEKIFEMKQRPKYNPLIIHYASLQAMAEDVEITQTAQHLANLFWPGPLTLVLKRLTSHRLSLLTSAGLETTAVRLPSHPWTRGLLHQLPFPLAAPSANRSGYLSPTCCEHVVADLGGRLATLVDGGDSVWGLESTVLDLSGTSPILLREGSISQETLTAALGHPVLIEPHLHERIAPSPGLLKSHYAPRQPLRLEATSIEPDEALLAFGDAPCLGKGVALENLSLSGNLEEAASRLFACLHRLEQTPCRQIAVMPIPEKGIGRAINDRLRRAAAPRAYS